MSDEPTPEEPRPRGRIGRAPKLTPEVTRALVAAFEHGATDAMACDYAGIARATFYRWMDAGLSPKKEYQDFRDEIRKARGKCAVADLSVISKAAQAGDWQASAWRLERRFPDTFGRRVVENRLTNATGAGPVVVATDAVQVAASVATMSPAQLRALTGTGTDDLAPDPEEEGGGER